VVFDDTIDDPLRGENKWSVEVYDVEGYGSTYNYSFTYRDDDPYISKAAPKNGVYLSDRSVTPYAKIRDPNGDNISAYLYQVTGTGGMNLKTADENVTSPHTITASYEASRGTNRWVVGMNDGKENVSSPVYEFETPHSVEVYGVISGALQPIRSRRTENPARD
jgi:hypothetical protein